MRRDCLATEVLLARSLLSATQADLAALIQAVQQALTVPLVGVISDGQHSIRRAVAHAEAAQPVYEADRHAKKALQKRVRGVRPIERQLAGRTDPEAEVIRGYCGAVRSARTDDGHPPRAAAGLKLPDRLRAIADSLDRVAKRGPSQKRSSI